MIVVCDMHRGEVEAVGTLEIVIDGERKRLDLCAEHLADARRIVRPWLKVATTTRPTSRATSASARRDSAAVRAWAAANGYDLPGRGRIPSAVHDAYEASK